MALDLRFARAPQILGPDRQAGERVDAEDDVVRFDDLAVFDRKRVERSGELVLRQEQRRRAAGAVPRRDARGALVEIGRGDRAHQRQARRRARARLAVRDHRVQPLAEDVLEIVQGDGERTAVRGSHLL